MSNITPRIGRTTESASRHAAGRGRSAATRRSVERPASAATATAGPISWPAPRRRRRMPSCGERALAEVGIERRVAGGATARSHVCTSTSVVSVREHRSRRALAAAGKVGRAVEHAVGVSSAPNSASAVARQRAAGSSRGRSARTPSGRSSRNSWKPITCSTNARASHSVHGVGLDHWSARTRAATRANPSHPRRCRSTIASTPRTLGIGF